ncbi:MAG: radical SAM protein [Thermoclostridium sp.]|nr:radical SAM protein [Thermoclostridium sp.]
MISHMNIPIFIPHEGCPNDCIFCNQRKISGCLAAPNETELRQVIQTHLSDADHPRDTEIAFFGGSFTGLPFSKQEEYLKIAEEFVRAGQVRGIRLSTRPDYIHEAVLDLLGKYSVKIIELGIQSLDQDVLYRSRRFYSPDTALKACRLVKLHGFSLGVQTMLGLPGDTLNKSLQTTETLIQQQPDMVRIYPTLVIRGTELENLYVSGQYQPLTLNDAVSWCSEIVPKYEPAGVRVLRIGLHNSENMKSGAQVVAGPVHPAFGELVYSEIWRRKVVQQLDKALENSKTLLIHVQASEVSKVIGQHHKNIDFLKQAYGFTSIKVLGDWEKPNSCHLEYHD